MEVTLPWAALCTDNRRHTMSRGELVPTREYAAAKTAATLYAMRAARGHVCWNAPVQVVGVAYFPDNRKRDAGNYRKLITDALTGIAYTDDSLVWREVWERGPIDRDNPRLVVTVSPLPVPP